MSSSTRRRKYVNIALALLAVLLVAVVVVTTGRVTTNEALARENNVLAAYREDDLTKLVIEQKGQRTVLERTEPDDAGETVWKLVAPIQEEADVPAMQKLLGSLEFATAVRRIKPEEVNRTSYGLDAPRLVVTIDMGAISYRLLVGKEAASPANASYLEVTGDTAPRKGVVIVSNDLIKELSVTASQLRGPELMPYLSASLQKLKLEGTGGLRSLRRAEWGGFRFDGMNGDRRVEREALDRVFLQFARTKAQRFLPLDQAEKALASGDVVTITMQPTDKSRAAGVVTVGGKCPDGEGVVAYRRQPDPLAACVPDSVMPGLTTPVQELSDRGLFSFRRDEIESLFVSLSGKRLELERKGDGFVLREPQKGDVDLEVGNQRLDALVGVRGEVVEGKDAAALGLAPEAGKVTVKSPGDDDKLREETVLIGRALPGGEVYVKRLADGAILRVSADSLRVLSPDATLVRTRKVLEFSERDLRALTVRSPGLEQRLTRQPSGGYELEAPKGFRHDAGLLSDVVDALANLVTDRWVSDTDDGSFGLAKPRIEVRLTLAGDGGSQEKVIKVGDATAGGACASLDGTPGVFVLPKRAVDALETPLLDRGAFVVDPAVTARIVLQHEGRTVTLEKQGDEFVERAAKPELSKGAIQQIVDALSEMRAEAALHTGAARANEGFDHAILTVSAESQTKGGEPKQTMRFRIGAGDAWRATSIFYGRADDVDATYVIARSKVTRVLDAL